MRTAPFDYPRKFSVADEIALWGGKKKETPRFGHSVAKKLRSFVVTLVCTMAAIGGVNAEDWISQDIGAVTIAGSTAYDATSDTFTIRGAGADIWGNTDQFHYVYQPISGDCEIVAKVASLQNTHNGAKAGVMVRESLAPESKNATVVVTAASRIFLQWRAATNGATTATAAVGTNPPAWVKLRRMGDQIMAFWSADGQAWQQFGVINLALGGTAYVGLAVTSHNPSALTTAAFGAVSLGAGGSDSLPSPWNHVDVGTPQFRGYATFDGLSVFNVAGGGIDISQNADAFHFVYQPLVGDGVIKARILNQQNTSSWAKAGSMIRESLTAGSVNGLATLTPGNGLRYQGRATQGGTTVGFPLKAGQAPIWTKVERRGEMVIGWSSPDGTTWNWLGSQRLSLVSQVYAGLAVTATDNGKMSLASFDNVKVTPGRENPLPEPWTDAILGVPTLGGWASYMGGAFQIFSGGGDIVGTGDRAEFVYQNLIGDGTLTLKVDSLRNSPQWIKAGIMMRESLASSAKNVFWSVCTGHGALWMKRAATGAVASWSSDNNVTTAPVWLRLERKGNTFSASKSSDGIIWTVFRSEAVPMATNIYVGAVVGSPNAGIIGEARIVDLKLISPGDLDGNALPDIWEQQYLGETGANPHGDPDGDGFSNYQEYLSGGDPTDGANQGNLTSVPEISLVSGDGQKAPAEEWLRNELVVGVQDPATGLALAGQPVTFSVIQGDAKLAANRGGAGSQAVLLTTDNSGQVRVSLKMGRESAVKVSARTAGSAIPVIFAGETIPLLAQWNFESGSTAVIEDVSGNGKDATGSGTLSSVGGIEGTNALLFDGTSSFLQTPVPGQSTATLMAWIRPHSSPDVSGIQSVIDCEVGGQYGTGWGLDNGKIKVILDNQFWDTGVSVFLNGWQHVALVYDASVARLYVNGILRASLNYSRGATTTGNYRIGRNASTLYFQGEIDDVRFYGGAFADADFAVLDRDGDGLLDSWERLKFGSLAYDGTADSDGDGFSDRQEFQVGSNAENYYQRPNGSGGILTLSPTIKVLDGTTKYGEAGVLGKPLKVMVTTDSAGTQLLGHAPVVFSVTGGYAGLTINEGTQLAPTVTLYSDANGIVAIDEAQQARKIRFLYPSSVGVTTQINVQAGFATSTISAESVAPAHNYLPKAYWPLNEGAGSTAFDAAGGDHDGALAGTVIWTTGHDGLGGVKFPAGDASAVIPAAAGLDFGSGSFSISLWFKSTDPAVQRLVSRGFWGWIPGYFVSLGHGGPGRVTLGIGGTGGTAGSVQAATAERFDDGAWHHVVAISDAEAHRVRVYVDGILRPLAKVGSTGGTITDGGKALDTSALTQLQASSPEGLSVSGSSGRYERFTGDLDEVRLYGDAVNELDVQNLYTGSSGNESVDGTAPGIPTGLRFDYLGGNFVRLRWNSSPGDWDVKSYRLYRDGQLLEESSRYVFSDATLVPGQTYAYTITAVDSADNESQPSPPLTLTAPRVVRQGTGVAGAYFDQIYLSKLVLNRRDRQIDFKWPAGTSPAPGIHNETFGARWTGVLEPEMTGQYTIQTLSDDGVRVWLDGRLIIDNWTNHFLTPNRATVSLEAGKFVSLVVEYFDFTDGGEIRLQWKTALDADASAIPVTALYPNSPVPDVIPPAVPSSPTATMVGDNDVMLKWQPGEDNVAVAAYRVFRDGQEVARVVVPEWRDAERTPATTYAYALRAEDFAGNLSSPSEVLDVTTEAGTLPEPWRHTDVGPVAMRGTADHDVETGKFTVSGSGSDVFRKLPLDLPDQCQFLYQKIQGNVAVTARIDSSSAWVTWAKTGIMIRESLDPLAPTALATLNHNVNLAPPFWIRLTRVGNTFYESLSPDGQTWQLNGRATVPMSENAYVGLYVSSHATQLATTVFSNVSVSTAIEDIFLGDTGVDTDGDGISNWQEINVYRTNPNAADIWVTGTVANQPGSQGATSFGSWLIDGNALVSQTVEGSVDYNVQVTTSGIYRIEFELAEGPNETGNQVFPVSIFVDGVFVDRFDVDLSGGGPVLIHAATPWLTTGAHTVRLSLDNTMSHRSLKILGLRLQSLGGLNPDANNIPAWMGNLLDGLNSIKPVTENLTSPVCLEGTSRYLKTFKLQVGNQESLVNPAPGFGWYANVPLDPSAPVQATASFESGGRVKTVEVAWKRLNLILEAPVAGQPPLNIRKGDRLLLTAYPQEGAGSATITVTRPDSVDPETLEIAAPRQQAQPYLFDEPGSYVVNATFTGEGGTPMTAAPLTVKVHEVDFNGDPVVGWYRQPPIDWDNPLIPDEAVIVQDQGIWLKELAKLPAGGAKFSLWSSIDEGIVAARLGGEDGPIAAHAAVRSVRVASDENTAVDVLENYDDGSTLVGTPIMLDRVPPGVRVVVDIIVGGSTFDDGTIRKVFTAADFDQFGRVYIRFILPKGLSTSFCHRVTLYDGDTYLGTF